MKKNGNTPKKIQFDINRYMKVKITMQEIRDMNL